MNKFAAKMYFVTEPKGKVKSGPPKGLVLLEERIILIEAPRFSVARGKADADAKAYCEDVHRNIYGQVVKTTYTGVSDIYELNDADLVDGAEATELRPKKPSKSDLKIQKIGRSFGKNERKLRLKFMNADFNLEHKLAYEKSLGRKKK